MLASKEAARTAQTVVSSIMVDVTTHISVEARQLVMKKLSELNEFLQQAEGVLPREAKLKHEQAA